jgi:hypothetical protein
MAGEQCSYMGGAVLPIRVGGSTVGSKGFGSLAVSPWAECYRFNPRGKIEVSVGETQPLCSPATLRGFLIGALP